MPGYKRYLYTKDKIPRSTAYRMKRRALKERRLWAINATLQEAGVQSQSPESRVQATMSSPPFLPVACSDEDCEQLVISPHAPAVDSNITSENVTAEDAGVGETSERSDHPVFAGTQSKEKHGLADGTPLCPCTSVTADDVVLMCLALCMRHNWTWSALIDNLKMIRSIFPSAESIPQSSFKLFQKVNADKLDLSFQIFCPDCDKYLKPRDSMAQSEECDTCGRSINVSQAANYFCSLPLAGQLKSLLEGPNEIGNTILSYRFNRQKQEANSLEDIYDGSEYQEHSKPGGILHSPHNFSYNFFTDGVPMGHSNKTIWPIYISINELPYEIRGKYILLAGIYVGPKDPNLNVFLKPFVEDANRLSTDGFEWSNNGTKLVSKVIPMCCVADSVARCKILNMQTFHAFWGCTFCYQVQERTSRRLKFTVNADQHIQQRTKESTRNDVARAFEKIDQPKEADRHFRGVKGPSCLAELNYFDTSHGVVVDYMHCLLLGVIKAHMDLLFDSAFKKRCWLLVSDDVAAEDIISAIDCRLLFIRPPKSITRAPESLGKRKSWKASQWRSWLLYFCIVCLQGLLKEEYLTHIAMLSKAACIILQGSITMEELQEAHALFLCYQFHFQKLFGKEHMYYNVHLLSHICNGVQRYGPVWTHNAFVYEGNNRHLLQLYKSPFNVALQISRKYLVFKSFPDTCVNLASSELTFDFCEDILDRHLKRFVRGSNALLLGKGIVTTISQDEVQCLRNSSKESSGLLCYNRMLLNGYRLSIQTNASTTRNTDCYALTKGGDLVAVRRIVKLANNDIVIIGQKIEREPDPLVSSKAFSLIHIKRTGAPSELACIDPKDISEQCVYMDVGQDQDKYVSPMVYGCYGD